MLATILSFQRDQLRTLTNLTARYGDVVAYRFGPIPVVLVNHPDGVNRVLQDNHLNYGKHNSFYKMMKWFLGDGLLTSDGSFWRRQRRLAQPAFQRKRLDAMAPMMVSCTQDMLRAWQSRSWVDATVEMMRVTLRVVGFALFTLDLDRESQEVAQSLEELQVQMSERFQSLLPLPPVLPTPRDRRFRECHARLSRLVLGLVQDRRRTGERPPDLLTNLIEAKDAETGETMSDVQIRDELVTFLLAGHETTANTLSWALILLSRHPDVRRRMEAELAELGRPPTPDDKLPFTERVILETLRLYPPAYVFGRCTHKPDQICGYDVGANQNITIAPYILHRHPQFWDNPEGFDPDRFLQERPKGAFIPFAAGPRQCIGNYFALLEARMILATMVGAVRLNLQPGFRLEADTLITLRPHGGVPMTLQWAASGARVPEPVANLS